MYSSRQVFSVSFHPSCSLWQAHVGMASLLTSSSISHLGPPGNPNHRTSLNRKLRVSTPTNQLIRNVTVSNKNCTGSSISVRLKLTRPVGENRYFDSSVRASATPTKLAAPRKRAL